MDSTAFDYLLRLSALSVAFVGFSAIVVTLRRGLGGKLSPFHVLLVRVYIETGLAVAAAGLIPSLLHLLGLASRPIWQWSSAVVGIAAPVMLGEFVWRRSKIDRTPPKARIYFRYVVSAIAVTALWLNVAGVVFQPSGGPYAVALTWFLLSAALVFAQTLDEVVYGAVGSSKGGGK